MNLKVLPILSKESKTGYNSLLPKVTSVTHHQYHICNLVTICTWHSAGWTCCCKFILLSSTAYKLSWDILSAVQDSRKLFLVRWRTLLFFAAVALCFDFFQDKVENAETFRRADYRFCLIYLFSFYSYYEAATDLCAQRKAIISRWIFLL